MVPFQALRPQSLTLTVVLLFGCCDAYADGKFFGRIDVADEPGIQSQRGLVTFKDGVETLIVQSDVAGVGESFGWILPLPSAPTAIEPCESNTLTALSQVIRPKVVKFPKKFFLFSMLWVVLILVACPRYVHRLNKGDSHISIVGAILGILVVLFMAMFSVSKLGMSSPDAVEVLQSARAGVYDVSIIKGETGAAVGRWLSSNGFASSKSADSVISDYVADGWCFLTAKISADAKDAVTHHPLKITFPVKQAVYPMRLTGVTNEPIQLDLYVIGDRRASVEVMKTWVADTFARGLANTTFRDFQHSSPTIYRGRKVSRARFGIPAISDLMWPECTMTRLRARLDPSDMREDLKLQWVPTRPTRARLYSLQSAAGWCGGVGAITLAGILIFATASATRQGWTWQMLLRRRLPVAMILGIAVGGVWFLTMEIVPVKEDPRALARSIVATSRHAHALQQLSEEPPGADFPTKYEDTLEFPDDPTRSKLAKPGDYKIEPNGRGWNLTIIDRPFVQITIPITSNGVPQPFDAPES